MSSLAKSAEGMAVQAKFMEIIAQNIANAQTTKGADGEAYRRRIGSAEVDPRTGQMSIRIAEDPGRGRLVYDPGHPDADENGFVEFPNVDVSTEMVDLMLARRLHEANSVVFQAAKSMLRRALEI